MYKVEITETCLRDGYNKRFDRYIDDLQSLKVHLANFCTARNIDPNKITSRFKSVERGTAKGVKLFYTPQPGVRIYVWINVYEEKRLV